LNVLKLVNAGVPRKMRSSSRPAVFVAPQVLEIISAPAPERR
jgi:hypothetical protein